MNEAPATHMVTGAFGYTGRYIAKLLLSRGKRVATITGHPDVSDPLRQQITVLPLYLDNYDELRRSLEGVNTLYNTYWVRFPKGLTTYEKAVENTQRLIKAAEEAGVRRFVHISITNASAESTLPYFRGKGILENVIVGSKLSYVILRPTVIFGFGDILLNNIAWLLRRLPLFAVPGSGEYRVQPVFVEDLAELAVNLAEVVENIVLDAVGPETYSYNKLVRLIAYKTGGRAKILHVSPKAALFLGKLLGLVVKDVVITENEIKGLMAGLLVSDGVPTARTRLSEWLDLNADSLGVAYASEVRRHYR
ncbi:MAG: NAD-dependent epimerase/dehydratase family protein [Dehalococcoidia bacterium]|nr:NAD-dependent epimerase/dehydratase family protein [Dehalococcoidia bacterium]